MQVKVIFFDINETLLDLSSITTSIANALGGRPDLVPLWFSNLLHHSVVETLTGQFHSFGEIGVAALKMVAENRNIPMTDELAKQTILTPITQLPPHPDVVEGLNTLKQKGYTLVALSNSSCQGLKAQLAFAKLDVVFHQQLSVETVQAYKPSAKVYNWAMDQLQTSANESLMVAAHHWDLAGAKAVGMNTAFINRPGKTLYPLGHQPDLRCDNIITLANTLPILETTHA